MIKCVGFFAVAVLAVLLSACPALARGGQSQGGSSSSNGSSSSSSSGIAWNDGSQRNIDDRQLNSFGSEFLAIDPKAPQAPAQLKDLATRVETYHQALFKRTYNAMDILKDTEDLQKRIEAQRAKLPAPKPPAPGAPVPLAPGASPAPTQAPTQAPPP